MADFEQRTWTDGETWDAAAVNDLEDRTAAAIAETIGHDELPVREVLAGPSLGGPRPIRDEQRISTFQTGHGYVQGSGGTGTLSDGTNAPGLGTKYLRMVTAGTGTTCRPTSPTLSPAVDLTGRHFRIMLRIDKPDQPDLAGITLYVSSDAAITGANFAQAPVLLNTADRSRHWEPGGWAAMTLDRGAFSVTGTVDWTSIKQVRLAVVDQVGHPVTVDWQLVSTVPAAERGVVTWAVDDGFRTNATIMRERLDLYGMPATLALIAERAMRGDAGQDSSSLTTNQIRSLVHNSGWEVVPHAYTGAMHDNAPGRYTSYTDDEVAADWNKLQAWLAAQGLGGATLQQFCWPGGMFDPAKLALARRFFAGITTTHPAHNTLAAYDPMRIARIQTAGPGRLATLKAHVDRCAANGTWLVFMLHDFIETGTPSGIQMNRADWEALVDYVAAADVDVRTVGDVLARG